MRRALLTSFAALSGLVLMVSCSQPAALPTSIQIAVNGNALQELTLEVGDTIDLDSVLSPTGVSQDVKWEVSDQEVATINENGIVTALSKGTAIVKATSKVADYVSKSVFLEVKAKAIQEGVGTGTSVDDPVFKGEEGDETLEIYFLEMQHIYADSVFIKKGNVEILIDAGWAYDGEYINSFLDEHLTDGRLDVLMATHSDGDHIDGMSNALEGIDEVSLIVDYGGVSGGAYGQVKDDYIAKGTQYHSAWDSVNFLNGASNRYYLTDDFYFDVLQTGNYIKNTDGHAGNGNSLSVIFHYKQFSFFTAGDLTSSSESDLLRNEDLPEVTLYKAAHHGSHGSNTSELMNVLNPKGVAISAARANNYTDTPGIPQQDKTYNLNGASGHPAAEAVKRIYQIPNISQNLNVYWNMVNGTMKFETEGQNNFRFEGSKPMKGYYDLSLTDGKPVWNAASNDFENKVTGEENFKLHESKVFTFRNYEQYLPNWAKNEFFPND